jgi:hypothetical protein
LVEAWLFAFDGWCCHGLFMRTGNGARRRNKENSTQNINADILAAQPHTCIMVAVYPFSVDVMKHTSSELPTLSKFGKAVDHTRGCSC